MKTTLLKLLLLVPAFYSTMFAIAPAQATDYVIATPPADLKVGPLADDGSRHFVMIFGAESSPKRARYTHTWATWVKSTPQPDGTRLLAIDTISWMPANLVIRPLALRGECGINLGLQATLRDCFCKGECVAMWGPYEYDAAVAPQVYDRVLRQIARLNSGCMLYKCIDPDSGPRARQMCDCIHAVTDLDPYLSRPFYSELQNFGMDASRRLVQVLAGRHRFDVGHTHEWIAAAVGVGNCVQRRTISVCTTPACQTPGCNTIAR
ncbi:MAG: hypothetical protein QM775_23145 [Pirellulales bacterium]